MLQHLTDCERPPNATRNEALIAGALTIVAALAVAAIMIVLRDPLGETIGLTMTPAVLVVGSQFLYLRGRPWPIKLLFTFGPLIVTFVIGLLAGWVGNG